MMKWLTIPAGIVCVLLALQQLRMVLIYMGRIQSSVVGPLAGPQPALIHTALLDALKFTGFAIVLFLTTWPTLVTYLLAVLLIKSGVDFVLAVCQVGCYGLIELTQKGRAYTAALELVPTSVYLVAVLVSRHFLGS